MKYDKKRRGYVLSREEVEDLNAMMEAARKQAEDLALYQRLRGWLPVESWQKKFPN